MSFTACWRAKSPEMIVQTSRYRSDLKMGSGQYPIKLFSASQNCAPARNNTAVFVTFADNFFTESRFVPKPRTKRQPSNLVTRVVPSSSVFLVTKVPLPVASMTCCEFPHWILSEEIVTKSSNSQDSVTMCVVHAESSKIMFRLERSPEGTLSVNNAASHG